MDGTRIGKGAERVHTLMGHVPNTSGAPCCSEISPHAGGVQCILYSASSPGELKLPGVTARRWTRVLAIGCYVLEIDTIQQCFITIKPYLSCAAVTQKYISLTMRF